MTESSLAELVPLWVTLRDAGVTALVTPAGDYVGGLQLGTLDVRFADDAAAQAVGEAARGLTSALDEGVTLQFLCRVAPSSASAIAQYEELCGATGQPELRAYVASRAEWLRARPCRRTSLTLFFSSSVAGSRMRGQLGSRLPFRRASSLDRSDHDRALQKLAELRDRLVAQLAGIGIATRDLDVEEVRAIHFDLLNPARAGAGDPPPRVVRVDDLWSEETLRREGDFLREYTEAEQLVHEDLQDARGHFVHGGVFRRVCTLKVLPEDGTGYFSALPLLAMTDGGTHGESRPFAYWLATTVHIPSQASVKRVLNYKHRFVQEARNLVARIRAETVEQEEGDRARQESIRALFEELHAMSSRIASLSVSLLLEGRTLEDLATRTESARRAFAACGNSQLLVEDVTQVAAFLSMLPGGGPYQLRRKGVTSRNAADFLPLYAPWRGCVRPCSLVFTPEGDLVQLDLFDKALSSAHHGLVVGDTGSGKSLTMGFLTLEVLAAGAEAVLVDNGGSWRLLTQLFGGTHIEVDLKTSIAPFQEFAAVYSPEAGTIDNEELENVVLFLENCLHDRDLRSLDKLQTDVLSRAIRWWYETRLRGEPQRRPLMGDFREALARFEWTHPDDRAIADGLVRHLRIFCDGLYGEFLNRPSALRFDAPLLTLDLQHVSQKASTKRIAMAVIMQALGNRARHRRRRTLVAVDEGHEYLGQDEVAERFLGGAYRKMRKFDTAMWMLTQQFADFVKSGVGDAIVGNAALKIFLHHASNRSAVADHFKLSRGAREAFDRLSRRAGHYSDLLLLYGAHVSALRLAPHPVAYWILTTDPEDRAVRDRAMERNARLPPLEVIRELAARYPHGVVGRSRAMPTARAV